MMNDVKTLQEKLAEMVCNAVSRQPAGWSCNMAMLAEPKMPFELILEDAE